MKITWREERSTLIGSVNGQDLFTVHTDSSKRWGLFIGFPPSDGQDGDVRDVLPRERRRGAEGSRTDPG